jgi:hypothetical protein
MTDNEINELSKRAIESIFHKQDESHLFPVYGRFNVTNRAIGRLKRQGQRLRGLEYYLALEQELSSIVNIGL